MGIDESEEELLGLVEETVTELKLGHMPDVKCSEAFLERLEAEKTALHHLHFTTFGRVVSDFE